MPYIDEFSGDQWYYTRDGEYYAEVYPTGHPDWATTYNFVVANNPLDEHNAIIPAPPSEEYGIPITSNNKYKCRTCYNYFVRYAWDPKSGAPQSAFPEWAARVYGLNGIETFFGGMETFMYDPNADIETNVHKMLSNLSLIPVLSIPASGVDSIIYLARKEYAEAALSAALMLPVLGDVKFGGQVLKQVAVTTDPKILINNYLKLYGFVDLIPKIDDIV
ncbi:hypothetical protein [Paenibacillus qinlingensis]|nr:hypothetical protein [Paenibacillus qinlingensis]